MTDGAVIIGLDVGTTHAKAAAHGADLRRWAWASRELPLRVGEPGRVEQDPQVVRDTALAVLAEVGARVAARGGHVAGVCLGTAMHGLIGLDARGEAVTPLVTWADQRAVEQARRLRAEPSGAVRARRTGAPPHAMTPLAKLIWFREQQPALFARVARWVSPKELLLRVLVRSDVVDHSIAGATGLLDLRRADWDGEALALAGVRREQLGTLVPGTEVAGRLPAELAARLGLPEGMPVVVGASDGALANLGAGALEPGIAACTVGTSGAVRLTLGAPLEDPSGRLFCYPLVPGRWVAGGAVNDGGVTLRWLRDALFPELRDAARARGEEPYDALTKLAAEAPPGAGGLWFLPGLSGERAPQRSPAARGVFFGLTLAHGRAHLVRAVLEGVMVQLSGVARLLQAAGLPLTFVRANGGAVRSEVWRQIMADAFGLPIARTETEEASSLGAALLGMVALGWKASLEEAGAAIRVAEQVHPSPGAAESAPERAREFERLTGALDPLFEALARG